jgi:RNA polymerase sigma factor (sigma-70 family)
LEHQTDKTYIERTLKGEEKAFSFLVDQYRDMVFTLALKLTANREEAEDASQEIFIKCYHGLGSFNHEASFGTWLYRITYNHCKDLLKKSRRQSKAVLMEFHGGFPEHVDISFDEKSDLMEIQEILKNAIKSLPGEDQVIVTLYYFEDLPLREIGDIIGIKENYVKIKLFRIRAKLQEVLKSKNEILNLVKS